MRFAATQVVSFGMIQQCRVHSIQVKKVLYHTVPLLVNWLRGDMHLGVMHVPTKPFFDWGVILGDTPDAALHSHLSTMTARRWHTTARRRHHHILPLNLRRRSPCPPSTSTDPLFNRGAFPSALQAADAINGRGSSSRR